MKVILLENVPKVGQKYDIKEVPNGYGRNFLIRQGKAKLATQGEEDQIVEKKHQKQARDNIQHDLLVKNIEKLKEQEVAIEAKANEKGHLFASISKEDVITAIKEQFNIDIPAETLEMEPIKEIGEHQLQTQTKGVSTSFMLKLTASE